MAKVAWIGLGAMGSRMAMRLVDAGHEVTVWNRSPHRAESLTRRDTVRVAASAAEAAAKAEVVALMVSHPAAIAEVVHGPEGVAAAIRPGSTLIDFSTVGPAAVATIRAELPPEVAVLDAPVLGSIAEAEAGTLKLLIGGAAEDLDRCRPLLSPLGELIHVGPLGTGAAAKLVANFALMGSLGVLGETLALADALGIEREATWELLEATPLAAQAQRRRPAIEVGSYPPRFALRLARKDADLITGAADERGVDLRLGRALAEWYSDAVSAGLGEQDYTALLGRILSAVPRAGESR